MTGRRIMERRWRADHPQFEDKRPTLFTEEAGAVEDMGWRLVMAMLDGDVEVVDQDITVWCGDEKATVRLEFFWDGDLLDHRRANSTNTKECDMMKFDASRAGRWKKKATVMAFQSDAAFAFFKSWGEQNVQAGGWVMVALKDGRPTGDVYGCEAKAFADTYEVVGPNEFRKTAHVEAYQLGDNEKFAGPTVVGEHVETASPKYGPGDWVLRNPGGEVYGNTDAEFRRTYVRA